MTHRVTDYLKANIQALVLQLLGEPKSKSGREWRYGRKGSLAIVVSGEKAGAWRDHEADEGGGPLDLIARQLQLDRKDALAWARDWAGGALDSWTPPPTPAPSKSPDRGRIEKARRLWAESVPIAGTEGERYLRTERGIPSGFDRVRFLPSFWYAKGKSLPAIIFRAESGAVQVVVIESGRKAPIFNPKRTYGSLAGTPVILQQGRPGDPLILAEGPESALSAVVAGAPGTVAAALSVSNFAKIGTTTDAQSVLLVGDGDPVDATARRTLRKAASEIAATGRTVRVLELPPTGDDINDLLQKQGPAKVSRLIAEVLAGPPWTDPDEPAPTAPFYPSSPGSAEEAEWRLKTATQLHMDRVLEWTEAQRALARETARFQAEAEREHDGDAKELRAVKREAAEQAKAAVRARFGCIVDNPAPRMLMKMPAGIGKTTVVTAALEGMANLVVWYLVPTDSKAREITADHPGFFHVRGRNEETCRRFDLAQEVARTGANVQKTLCYDWESETKCPHFEGCPFQAQRRQLEERKAVSPGGTYVGSHEYMRCQSSAPSPDLLVVDESHWRSLKATLEVAKSTLILQREAIWADGSDDPHRSAKLERGDQFVDAVTSGKPILGELRAREFTKSEINEAVKRLRKKAEVDESEIKPGMPDLEIRKVLDSWTNRQLGKIAALLEKLADEIVIDRDEANGIEYRPPRGQHDGVLVAHYFRKPHYRARPLLILDASADDEITRRLWEIDDSNNFKHIGAEVPRNAEIIQVRSKAFSNQSIKGVGTDGEPVSQKGPQEAAKLRREIAALAAGAPGPVVVIGNKGVEEVIKPELPEDTPTGHFAALRGLNAFEKCRTAIVVGREQPAASDVEAPARGLHRLDREPLITTTSYRLEPRARRMRDGRNEVAMVEVHPDPRVQRFLEQIREREIEQAVDRLRLVYNTEPKTVVILWSGVLDLTIDRTVSWESLVKAGDRITRAWAETGCVPLGRKEASRVHSRLGWTEQTARDDLAILRPIRVVPTPNRNIYLGSDPPCFVKYRRADHPSGEPLQALVKPGTEAEIEARLAAAVGPLAPGSFELVSAPDPLPVDELRRPLPIPLSLPPSREHLPLIAQDANVIGQFLRDGLLRGFEQAMQLGLRRAVGVEVET